MTCDKGATCALMELGDQPFRQLPLLPIDGIAPPMGVSISPPRARP